MADQASENAYQAALVTRDRALQARQDSIDVLQRLLAQMGDDPLVVQAKENLGKILENPEVITDEVFGNIMSKTSEVLDSNYDQQVSDVLNAARSKGVSGPALQLTLQRAKEARATAIAGAYRDALIERSNSGLKTNLEAINATSNLLNNLFQQQRVVTEDLVNTMQTIVEEPFRNTGPGALPQAGVIPGGGSSSPITMDFSQVDAARARQAAEYEAFKARTTQDYAAPGANATVYGNQADGTPGTKASFDAANAAAEQARQDAEIEKIKQQYGNNLPSEAKPGTGYITKDGIKYLVDKLGNVTPVTPGSGGAITGSSPSAGSYGDMSASAFTGLGSDLISSLKTAATDGTSAINTALTGAMSGLSSLGDQIAQNFLPSALKTEQTRVETQPLTTVPNTNINFSTPGGAAATAAEASRGASLVSKYGQPAVIGTTSGVGVRYDTSPSGSGKGVTSPVVAAPTQPTDGSAKYGSNFLGYGVDSYGRPSAKVNTGTGENYGKSWMWINDPAAAGPAGLASTPTNWWDLAKKAATSGFTGAGAALAGMFK